MTRLHPWPLHTGVIDFIQHVNVAPGAVWERLTTEAGLSEWLGTTASSMPSERGDPFHLTWETSGWRSGQSAYGYDGTIESVIPDTLLALNWRLPKSSLVTQMSIQLQQSFAAFGADTQIETDVWLTHAGFPADGVAAFEFDGHSRHWRQALGLLAAQLEGRPPKPRPYVLIGLKFVGGVRGKGLLVEDVAVGSPADRSGLRSGDILRAVNGKPLTSLDDFHDWIDHCKVGDSGVFDLDDRSLDVPVESVEDAMRRIRVRHGETWTGLASLGDNEPPHQNPDE